MRDRIHPSWENIIKNTTQAPYFDALTTFVEEEFKTQSCYPESDAIFAAFDLCPFNEVKVVLLGQDPYHGPGQAHGLSFSVPEAMKHPPSLVNIFKEIESDLTVGRVLVRPSGTENKIRVMVESDDEPTAKKYAEDIAKMFVS